MDGFLDARALGGLLASVPRCFRIDWLITVVPTVAWKQPCAGHFRQVAPVLAQFLEQFWAEHHIAVCASFAALNVNHHALAVDVVDLQMRQLGTSRAGGIERHE